MVEKNNNSELNRIIVILQRSLLQYVGECWPWTDIEAAEERQTFERLVAEQQSEIQLLTNLLRGRDWDIDFGAYPTEFTDLHFVALDFLLSQIIEGEKFLLEELKQVSRECADDAQASKLLEQITSNEHNNLAQLQELAKSRSSKSKT